MIPKLRNQGLIRLAIGFGLMLLAFVLAVLFEHTAARQVAFAMGVILGIVGAIIYYVGLADLLQAKGYSGAIVIGIVVLGFCIPLVSAFVMTPVVLFALKDKNVRHRSRGSAQHKGKTMEAKR
jgi:phosphotransferase system  glucose/maltose/N-acetylglucosamine-specific IIC component